MTTPLENLEILRNQVEHLTVTEQNKDIKTLVQYTKEIINITKMMINNSSVIFSITPAAMSLKSLFLTVREMGDTYSELSVFKACKKTQAYAAIQLLGVASEKRSRDKISLESRIPAFVKVYLNPQQIEFPEIAVLEEFSKIILTLPFEEQKLLIKALSQSKPEILSRLTDSQGNNVFSSSVSKLIKDGKGESLNTLKTMLNHDESQELNSDDLGSSHLRYIKKNISNPLLSLFGLLKLHEQQLTPADKALVNKYFEPGQPIVSETLNHQRLVVYDKSYKNNGGEIPKLPRIDEEDEEEGPLNDSNSSKAVPAEPASADAPAESASQEELEASGQQNEHETQAAETDALVLRVESEPAQAAAAAAPALPASQDKSNIATQSSATFSWKKIGMLALAVVAVGVAAFFAWPAIATAAGIAVAGGVIGTVALLTTAAVTYGAQKIQHSHQSEQMGNEVKESLQKKTVSADDFIPHEHQRANGSKEEPADNQQPNSGQDDENKDDKDNQMHSSSKQHS